MKVAIDYKLCRGHQMCIIGLPEVFKIGPDDEGRAAIISILQPEERREDLLRAVASCPEQAIRVLS